MRDENAVFQEYMAATGAEREALLAELVPLLQRHGHAVCYPILHEHRGDLVNLAIFKALNNAEGFRGDSTFSTWFHTIIKNLCFNALDKRKQLQEYGLDDLNLEETGKIATTDNIEPRMDLERLLVHLNERDQAFLKRKLYGESEQELAEWYGTSVSGVRQQWLRITNRLRRKLRRRSTGVPTVKRTARNGEPSTATSPPVTPAV